MLQRASDFLQRHQWLAFVVLGGIAFVFISWGAYGVVNLSFGGSNYAAEANGSKISLEQARNAWLREQAQWQQRLGGADIPPDLRTTLQNQVLESLIVNALLTERSHQLGYRVSHEALRDAVHQEPAFQVGGQYDPTAAKAALAQAGISLATYEGELTDELQRLQLEGGIRASGFVTSSELARSAELEDQEREVRYALLPAAQFAAPSSIDDAAIAAYYKANSARYMTAESAHLAYAELRLEALAAQQSVSDADLHAAYEKNKSQLEVPERRHAHHILLTGKDDTAALAQAQDVLAQAKSGKDFGELAKKYSQDPGSAQNGGDLGWADRKSFVAPFADALFAMSIGEIKGPVKTQFGYHIIRLDEIQPGKSKSFEEARPELEAQLRRDRATDHFGEIQEQLQTKLGEPGADLNALAQEFGLQPGDIANFLKGSGGAPLGPAPPVQDLVFGESPLVVGRVGGPVLLGDDRLVVVKVLEHRKPAPRPLADVRPDIVAALVKEQGTQAALKAAQAAIPKLDGGTSFDAVAHELKASADPAHFVGRGDPSIPGQLRTAVFAAPRPAAGKPVYRALALDEGGAALFALTQVRTSGARDREAKLSRTLEEARREGTADTRSYVEEVRRTADVRKNPKAFE